jgi:hypothetical protein
VVTPGRWTSPDQLEGKIGNPQSFNRYSYVQNDPVNFVDPSGLFCMYVPMYLGGERGKIRAIPGLCYGDSPVAQPEQPREGRGGGLVEPRARGQQKGPFDPNSQFLKRCVDDAP